MYSRTLMMYFLVNRWRWSGRGSSWWFAGSGRPQRATRIGIGFETIREGRGREKAEGTRRGGRSHKVGYLKPSKDDIPMIQVTLLAI